MQSSVKRTLEKNEVLKFLLKKLLMLLKIKLKTFTSLILINIMLTKYFLKNLIVILNNQNNYITLLAFIYNRGRQNAALKVKICCPRARFK